MADPAVIAFGYRDDQWENSSLTLNIGTGNNRAVLVLASIFGNGAAKVVSGTVGGTALSATTPFMEGAISGHATGFWLAGASLPTGSQTISVHADTVVHVTLTVVVYDNVSACSAPTYHGGTSSGPFVTVSTAAGHTVAMLYRGDAFAGYVHTPQDAAVIRNSAVATYGSWAVDEVASGSSLTVNTAVTNSGGSPAAIGYVSYGWDLTGPPDTTPPTLSGPGGTGGTSVCSGSVTTDEGNGILYAVVTASATAPTQARVKLGQDHTGAAALRVVSQAVTATGAQTIGSGAVTDGTRYFHYMQEDAATNQSSVVSSASFVVTAASDTTPPTQTGSITIGTVNTTTIQMSWPAGADNVAVSSYEVSSNGGSSYSDVGSVLTYTFTGLTPSTSYGLRVRAKDAAGNVSTPALSATQSTSAIATATLTSSPLKNNTGTLHLSAAAEAFVHNVTTGALVLKKTGLTSHATTAVVTFNDAALTAATQYRVVWRLTATGAEGLENSDGDLIMTCRVDTTSLISGACVIGNRGLGVLGSVIRATTGSGTNGAGFLYNDLTGADDAKEIRGLIVLPPIAGEFFAFEDGSFTLSGAPDGVHAFTYRVFADGVDIGTTTGRVTIGVVAASVTAAISGTITGVVSAFAGAANPSDVNVIVAALGTITGSVAASASAAAPSSTVSAAEVWSYVLPNGLTAGDVISAAYALMAELHKIHGLAPGFPMTVTQSSRTVGDISQSISDSAGVVTVARQ